MRKIHLLPDHIISQIAAGEVIERPVYAVKELVENAIDAKADHITITIEEAGLKKIIVTDNGDGMSPEDLPESCKPHTTSKLSPDDSLIGITSLGFRGEALASIAAISNMSIQSRMRDQTGGTIILLKNNNVEHVSPIGMPVGTTVIVHNLFSTIPARKKFLKTAQTEFRHIVDLITAYAISFPTIRFTLIHNQKRVLDLPKTVDHRERTTMILGHDVSTNLLPLIFHDSYLSFSGFISTPRVTSHHTDKQFIFINNRHVTDKLITLAIKEAYGNLLESTSYPVVVLFLTIPHEMVDVNVHPRKEQVSFLNNRLVFDSVQSAVKETLANHNITFHSLSWKEEQRGLTNTYAGKLLKQTTVTGHLYHMTKTEPITQFHRLYLATQTKNGILLIDQHAAHERILYERYKEAFLQERQKQKTYQLPKPLGWELSFSESEVLKEFQHVFQSFGFQMAQIQPTIWHISAIPELFKDRDIKKFLHEVLDDFMQDIHPKSIDHLTEQMLSYLACRAAIKAGDPLTKEQAKILLEQLEKTPNNMSCVHGRPTMIEMPLKELHAKFKRN